MYNLNAVVRACNLTPVEAGSFKDSHGFLLTYRPMFDRLVPSFGTRVASTSFVDAEDLFYSIINYNEINLVPTVTPSMVNFVARLQKTVLDYTDYHIDELMKFITIFEDRYSQHTYDEVRFFAGIRQDLSEESFRVGSEHSTLAALYNMADETLHYRKDYNS